MMHIYGQPGLPGSTSGYTRVLHIILGSNDLGLVGSNDFSLNARTRTKPTLVAQDSNIK